MARYLLSFPIAAVILTFGCLSAGTLVAQSAQSQTELSPSDSCAVWSNFTTFGQTTMEIEGSPNTSDFELAGQLIYRPLLAEEEFFWLGFELYEPSNFVDGELASSEIYSVPFAVKINAEFGHVMAYIVNAPLSFADRSKLQSIHKALHISRAGPESNPNDYIVQENDDIGTFETHYQLVSNETIKSKQQYSEASIASAGSIVMEIEQILINQDETRFSQDQCWHTQVEGITDLEIHTRGDVFNLELFQELAMQRRTDDLPADSKLMLLPLNPEDWEMLPEEYVYPRPERNPLASGDEFIQVLTSLDLSVMDSDDIQQFLFDNEEYLPLLKAPIWAKAFSDENERRLFLMVGQNDSENAHWLLSEVFVDESFDSESRFRGLMALKYAERPISMDLVEKIFAYSANDLSGSNAELAHSAVMTLGIIANNQISVDFGRQLSDRIALELRSSFDTQKKAALLTALGNAGDVEQQYLVTDYLANNSALLRERSAQALAEMPSDRTLDALSSQLRRETNSGAQGAILRAMGSNELQGTELNQVYEFAKNSQDREIRLAAIESLGKQIETTPRVETELRELLKTEKTQQNMQAILQALY